MDLRSEEVVYSSRGVRLRGFLAWDPARKRKLPGVLVVHEWWGHDEYVRGRARQLAGMGYAALAVDMYGDAKVASTPGEAQALMMQVVEDPALMRVRFGAARDELVRHEAVDAARLAAIGYCFGGAVVLQMARFGLDLRAVASFHPGSLAPVQPAQRGAYKAKTLVCIGAADPFVSQPEREAFKKEMNAAGVDLEFVEYPGVVHGFTVPAATGRGQKYGLPLAHDPQADRASWGRMEKLLARAFG